jgi:hypothetical protein
MTWAGPNISAAHARLSHLCRLVARGTIRKPVEARLQGEGARPCESTASADRRRRFDKGSAAPSARSLKEQAAG